MPRHRIFAAQFPGGNRTVPDVGNWLVETVLKMRADPTIGEGNVALWHKVTTPITMGRNLCLKQAKAWGADFVLMVDSDMRPDLPYDGAKPFWDVAWPFARDHAGPCVVAAPYCGPPPQEGVYTFRWEDTQTGDPNPNFMLKAHTRPEAARLSGIVRCGALPTGLMLIDVRALKDVPPPYFYYEYTDETQSELASTEDVTFSRDLANVGVPLYAAFDSWAGHFKEKLVGRPAEIPADAVPNWLVGRGRELDASGRPELDAAYRAWKEKPQGQYALTPKPVPAGAPS